jgi:non-specific protein-tyrosine kinase
MRALEDYLAILSRWWWLLVACTLVSAISSYLGTRQMPRIYQATVTVMVGQALEKSNPNTNDFYISQQLAQTYAEMVKRRPILAQAAQALGLQYVPSPGQVSTRQVAGTQLLEISVRDTIPERARALADQIARQLILQTPAGGEVEQRRDFIQQQLADLEFQIDEANKEIEKEQQKLRSSNSARAIQQYQANIGALQQKLGTYRATYASLLGTAQGATNRITVVESAATPSWPISPNARQIVLLGAAIGLALAVAGVVLIEFLDDTLKSPEEAIRQAGLPQVGQIPRMQAEEEGEKLVVARNPLSSSAEAYRVLRTNILFSFVDRPLTTLLVTSPAPGEGKSLTLANLAAVFAEAGKRVLIVDTDLRRPVQHRILSVSGAQGLSDAILEGESELLKYIKSTSIDRLFLLPAGQMPPNPSELLGSDRLGQIVGELQAAYDLVLFDSPPALMVADASILGSRVDATLLIGDIGRTRRGTLKQAVEQLKRGHVNVIGVVINRVAPASQGYGYMYGYYHPRLEEKDPAQTRAQTWGVRLRGLIATLRHR